MKQEETLACEATVTMEIPAEESCSDAHLSEEQHAEQPEKESELNAFIQELEKQSDAEAKLNYAMRFMENALSQTGSPHFKSFWQVRDLCVELFKENMQPAVRSSLWIKYSELTKEARRLKSVLDEQSAFAVEQIEIAIQALETDIAKLEEQKTAEHAFPITPHALEERFSFYCKTQYQLDLLNTQASRINALRKEIIKTDMRIRKKNQFFQRLSLAGDRVFPRRKELIKEISTAFLEDVDGFISSHFAQNRVRESLFILREEIKALQSIAKMLTLNAQAFTRTRVRLSECWDKIKLLDKERKQYRAEQKALYKENVDAILKVIHDFAEEVKNSSISTAEGQKKLEDIYEMMRSRGLGREELGFLREEIDKARQPLIEKAKEEENQRLEQEKERMRVKQKRLLDLNEELKLLLQSAAGYDLEQLLMARDAFIDKIHSSQLQKTERHELEKQLKPLRDIITEKKEQSLLNLSADDRQCLIQLRELITQRKARRQEIKDQLEILRKASGSSGLDFEKAMEYNTLIHEEKERLEKLNHSIQEVEEKIAELEKGIR